MRELQAGSEVAVATPGRLIDLVRSRACDLRRVTLLIVDEVDRCFDLGFEAQARPTPPDHCRASAFAQLHLSSVTLRTELPTAMSCVNARIPLITYRWLQLHSLQRTVIACQLTTTGGGGGGGGGDQRDVRTGQGQPRQHSL